MSYRDKLAEMGIVDSRIDDLDAAMAKLHSAVCKLDNQQLALFGSTFGIIGHLDTYCRAEGMRNVAHELYTMALKRAAKKINFEEFQPFADRLYHLAEEAAEVQIPGALQLCRSLRDLSKKRGPFAALAAKALAVQQLSGTVDTHALRIRNTHKFVGTHQHRDDWTDVGTTEFLQHIVRHEDMDGSRSLQFVRVLSSATQDEIKQALHDTHTSEGCSCEHDCCGCVSQRVSDVKRLTEYVWVLRLTCTRNI